MPAHNPTPKQKPSNLAIASAFSALAAVCFTYPPDSVVGMSIDKMLDNVDDTHSECVKGVYSLFDEIGYMQEPIFRAAFTFEIRLRCAIN